MPLVGVDVKGAAEAVGGILSGLGDFGLKLRSAITGKIDPGKEAELLLAFEQINAASNAAKDKINEVEAASVKTFVAGWRPYIGWICGTVVGAVWIPRALVTAWMWVRQVAIARALVPYPALDLTEILGILGTLLGAGYNAYLRTQEKKAGVAGNH